MFAISIDARASGSASIRAANIVVDFPISRSVRWKIRTSRFDLRPAKRRGRGETVVFGDEFARGRSPLFQVRRAPITWMMLTPRQSRFVQEYLLDLNGKQAAIRAGYSPKTAEVQGSRLLGHPKVQAAVDAAMQARSRRTEVAADRVVAELAKIAFANMRDFWPTEGETLDLSRLDQDRTAAIEEVAIDEAIDTAGTLHRRIRVKLHDKLGALTSLARHLGMFTDGVGHKSSLEARVSAMSPAERVACANELLEGAQKYLPLYEAWERKRSREG